MRLMYFEDRDGTVHAEHSSDHSVASVCGKRFNYWTYTESDPTCHECIQAVEDQERDQCGRCKGSGVDPLLPDMRNVCFRCDGEGLL